MRLIFIRHAEPDYVHDSLTAKGFREAELLSERVSKWPGITQVFCSPCGRAQDTAAPSLKKLGIAGVTLPWLEEIYFMVRNPETGTLCGAWDWMPRLWTAKKEWYGREWFRESPFREAGAERRYREMAAGLDALLAHYGYQRAGDAPREVDTTPLYYTTHTEGTDKGKRADDTTLVFFCHFGITSAMLSHLIGISMLPIVQNFFCAPSSVTVVAAEEREPRTAAFRCQTVGDCHHLIVAGEPVSPSGYFTDTFSL